MSAETRLSPKCLGFLEYGLHRQSRRDADQARLGESLNGLAGNVTGIAMAGSHARLSPHRDAPPPTAVLGGDFLHGQNRALVELGRLIDRSKSRDDDGYFHPLRFPAPFHTVIINKENGGCFHHGETLLQAGGPRSISRRNGKDASPSLADSSPRSAHTAALRHHSIAHRHRLLHLEGATHGIDSAPAHGPRL
jgi:hypothetical protein